MNDLMSVISVVVTSAVVATMVGKLIDIWRERSRISHTTKLDALRIAVLLEGYAISCSDLVADHEDAVSSEGFVGKLMGKIPTLPRLEITAGIITYEKARIADELLTLVQEIEQANQQADFWWNYVGDQESGINAAKTGAAEMGRKSLGLAQRIRKAFDLPVRKLVFGKYDVEEILLRNDASAEDN